MRYTLTSILFMAGLAAFPALAAEQHAPAQAMNHEAMQAMPQGATHAMPMNDGVAKKLDVKNARVTLQHGDIPGVMPAMTMGYRVGEAQQLKGIRVGDKVRFAMEKVNEEFVVVHIETVK